MTFTGRLSALQHPYYRRYWSGSFASVGATQLQTMAQGWLLYELTSSTVALGYLGAAASIPAIIMTLFGGVLADRINKKRLLMTTSLTITGLSGLMAFLDYSGLVAAWHVILLAAVISFISGFDWPTRQAMFPTLIAKEDMMSAVALNSLIWQSTRMIMPALGGVIIAITDTWLIFLLCAIGFFTMFTVIASLPAQAATEKAQTSSLHQLKEGVNFVLHTRVFLVFLILSYGGMFFGMAHLQLMPAFSDLLGTGEKGYGFLISATGVGSVAGTLLVGSFDRKGKLGIIITGSALASAASVIFFSLATLSTAFVGIGIAYALSLFMLFLISMFSSIFMISSMTVLQLRVPDHLRGRVMGIHSITYSLMPLGGLFAGFLAEGVGVAVAIIIAASCYIAVILGVFTTQRSALEQADEAAPAAR